MQVRSSESSSHLRLGASELQRLMRMEPRLQRQQMLQAAENVLDCIQTYSRRGTGVLADVLGKHTQFEEWAHYPNNDAVDARTGYRFYYHAHAASGRMAGEHGHFHVFGPAPTLQNGNKAGPELSSAAPPDLTADLAADNPPGSTPDYTHLVGISVDERGFPLRLFTTNRWVTAEQWLPAPAVIRTMHKIDMAQAKPAAAARWVEGMVRLFAVQIAALVQRRDARIATRTLHADPERVFEDRRTHILSQCRIDLAKQFQFLEGAGIG